MPTTISLTFPLGRYHATPWNRAANDGASEWPPSPWRLLRGLISTWHLRWPGLPEADMDTIIASLLAAPAFRAPAVQSAQTRHYMPDFADTAGSRSTDLVLDSFLSVPSDQPVLVRWDADLQQSNREVLAKLCELLPYLGRSESVVSAQLLTEDPSVDESWWQPLDSEDIPHRLLAPTPATTRAELELTPTQVRKDRRALPPTSRLVSYRGPSATELSSVKLASDAPGVEAIRWRLMTRAPFLQRYGILATDVLRRSRTSGLDDQGFQVPPTLLGRDPKVGDQKGSMLHTGHRHAHWLWMAGEDQRLVEDLVLWMPEADLPPDTAVQMMRRSRFGDKLPYHPRGFRTGLLQVTALGTLGQVAPEIAAASSVWRTRTPYLPQRHRGHKTWQRWIFQDVARECQYRGHPEPTDVHMMDDRQLRAAAHAPGTPTIREYRRYRMTEDMSKRRDGAWLEITFDQPVSGPLCLGKLSHFGFGLFVPVAN
jgi:CRISPR-associated protein Csb2